MTAPHPAEVAAALAFIGPAVRRSRYTLDDAFEEAQQHVDQHRT